VPRERVVVSPIDLFLDEHNVLQPDVLILREGDRVRRHERRLPLPALVVEVLSPATARRDRTRKARRYLAAGIPEVWIVDPDRETVELRTAEDRHVASGDEELVSQAVPGFRLRPSTLLRE
jgi:Uma2 family endonuclease